MRGIISSFNLEIGPGSRVGVGGPIVEPSILRMWVLYWDKIELPQSHIVSRNFSDHPEIIHLARNNVVTNPIRTSRFSSGSAEEFVLDSFRHSFSENEFLQPGSWAFATGAGTLKFHGDEKLDRALQVDLVKCVPTPKPLTPIDRVLEFRDRHLSERLAFMELIDELYLEIENAPDKPLAELMAKQKLEKGIADIQGAAKSSNSVQFELASLKSNFDIPKALLAAGAVISSGAPLTAGLGVGVLTGLNVRLGPSLNIGRRKSTKTPYEYVCNIQDRLEWD